MSVYALQMRTPRIQESNDNAPTTVRRGTNGFGASSDGRLAHGVSLRVVSCAENRSSLRSELSSMRVQHVLRLAAAQPRWPLITSVVLARRGESFTPQSSGTSSLELDDFYNSASPWRIYQFSKRRNFTASPRQYRLPVGNSRRRDARGKCVYEVERRDKGAQRETDKSGQSEARIRDAPLSARE